MSPVLSIIIPVCNAEATLARCLNSVLTQSLRDIEVICISDGSTDGSMEILRQFVAHEGRLHVFFFEKNYGVVIAVKMGLLNAKGKYVMFVDSDDVLLPGACENAARLIEKHDVDVLQFGVKINVPSGTDASSWQKTFAPKDWKSEGVNLLYDCYSLHRFPHNTWNKIYRREVCRAAVETMPELQVSQAADVLQTFFFLYYAKTFRSVTDGPYYEYFVGNGISTHTPTAKQFEKVCAASAILPAIEWFLKRENALDKNRFLLDSIEIVLKSDVVNKLLTLPEITKETIDLAVKSWGSEAVYDFIKATGLFDVTCQTRYNLIPTLVNQIRQQQNRPSVSAAGRTLSVGQSAK